MALMGTKAVIDVIKAKAAGERAQVDLRQAIQLMQAGSEIDAQEAQQKQVEERKKAQQQAQSKQQAPTPPDFVSTGGVDDAGGVGTAQTDLDQAGQAVGGAGAQGKLNELQQNRALQQQGLPGGQGAPGGGGVPPLAQAIGQGGGQQVPDRLNTVSFQSQTGGRPDLRRGDTPSLARAIGQPVNTVGFQSEPNALSPFQAGQLGIARQRNVMEASKIRAQLFTEVFTKIPDITPAQAQAGVLGLLDGDKDAVSTAFAGSEDKLRQLNGLALDRAILENEKLEAEIGYLNAQRFGELGLVGETGTMSTSQILGILSQSDDRMDDAQLFDRTQDIFAAPAFGTNIGERSKSLIEGAEIEVPWLQANWLDRDRVLIVIPEGEAGRTILEMLFGEEPPVNDVFGIRRAQEFLDAMFTLRDPSASDAQFAKAERMLMGLYVSEPVPNAPAEKQLFQDDDGNLVSMENINKTVADNLLAMWEMVKQAQRADNAAREQRGGEARKMGTMTWNEFKVLRTNMELIKRASQAGLLGTATNTQ
jgi:hypothetical protein